MDRLEEMRTFIAIAENGVTGAATRLRIAPSAVSRRLKDLEVRLGADLMTRTTRRMNLTEAGRVFLSDSQRIVEEVEAAEARVSDVSVSLSGQIRLAAPLSFGISHLQPLLNSFMNHHSEITLDVDLDDRRVDIQREGYDLAIRIGALEDSSLQVRKIASYPMLPVASEGFIDRYGEPVDLADISNLPAVCYSPLPRPEIWSCEDEAGRKKTVTVSPRLFSNNGDVLRDAAIDGVGLALLPGFIVGNSIAEGRLRNILEDYVWRTADVYVLRPARQYVPQRVRQLVDFLAANLS